MSTNTTRLGLTKPSGSAAPEEAVDIGVINTNMDNIDRWMGCILVNDGVTPATGDLFDGAIVKERTSGIIWEARKNGGGTFDKVYVRYPFHLAAYRAGAAIVAGTTTVHTAWAELDAVTAASCKNASASNLVGGKFSVPIKGIYLIKIVHQWANSAAGSRSLAVSKNGTTITGEFEKIEAPNASFQHMVQLEFTDLLAVGDTIGAAGWQNTGGNLDLSGSWLRATLIEPVQ